MTSATTPVSGQREPELAGQPVVVIGGSFGARSSLSSQHPSGDYAVRPPSMYRISPVMYGADSRYRMPSTMSLT